MQTAVVGIGPNVETKVLGSSYYFINLSELHFSNISFNLQVLSQIFFHNMAASCLMWYSNSKP